MVRRKHIPTEKPSDFEDKFFYASNIEFFPLVWATRNFVQIRDRIEVLAKDQIAFLKHIAPQAKGKNLHPKNTN